MPESYTLPGNTNFVSSGGVIYFGVRNGLGYFLEDVFLHVIENHYFKNGSKIVKEHVSKDSCMKNIFKKLVKQHNPTRCSFQQPEYLKLTESEKQQGLSSEEHPFFKFKINITIPTLEEIIVGLSGFHSCSTNHTIKFDFYDKILNKIVVVGNDTNPDIKLRESNIQSFHDAANSWVKNKGYRLLTKKGNEIKSGKEAIMVLSSKDFLGNPLNELYFSTHGAPYAIDFNNGKNNLYTSLEQMSSLTNENPWIGGKDKAFIEDIAGLVKKGCIAPDVIITLGGCLTGALTRDVPPKAEPFSLVWKDKNMQTYLPPKYIPPENFACILSKALPNATIVANRAQTDSGIGLKIPVMYQNGDIWHITFPETMEALNGESKTTIYHGW